MMKRPVLFFVVMAVTGQADTVIFRNGARLDGIWMGSDAQNVRLMVNGAMQTYLKTDVSAVNFDPQSAPAPAGFPAPPRSNVPAAGAEPVGSRLH